MLGFSTLTKVLFLNFWSDKPTHRTNSVHVAEPVRGLHGQKLCIDGLCPILLKFTFLKSSWTIVQNINHPAKANKIFQKVGTPNLPTYSYGTYNIKVFLQTLTKIGEQSIYLFIKKAASLYFSTFVCVFAPVGIFRPWKVLDLTVHNQQWYTSKHLCCFTLNANVCVHSKSQKEGHFDKRGFDEIFFFKVSSLLFLINVAFDFWVYSLNDPVVRDKDIKAAPGNWVV